MLCLPSAATLLAAVTLPRVSRHLPPQCSLAGFDENVDSQQALETLLHAANLTAEPTNVEEMSAGFCNWVYRVDLPDHNPVVVKLFSPLAKLRLEPALRGCGDEEAGAESLGPRLLYRSPDGMVCDFIEGETLTESDMHAPASDLPALIAPRLAALHGEPLPLGGASSGRSGAVVAGALAAGRSPILWQFLNSMVDRIAEATDRLPPGLTLAQIRSEVERMRRRCDALSLPLVRGHGDLKPSNVMAKSRDICFIDFELAGCHYRGYDLFKLFRTAGPRSAENMRTFLRSYLSCRKRRSEAEAVLELEELEAEANAAEPLTWLEAAVFFCFATCVYPSQSAEWTPLALQRWEAYLQSAASVDEGGVATNALLAARQKRVNAAAGGGAA